MKISNKIISIFFLLLIWNCSTPTTSMMPSKKKHRIVANHQIDLEQSFYGWKDEYGYILIPYNELIKCIYISYNGIEYTLGITNYQIIKFIATSDKRFSVDGYKIGDEITKTQTIPGWGHYTKINEEWYAAWFSEDHDEKSGKIQWFFKYDFDKPLNQEEIIFNAPLYEKE